LTFPNGMIAKVATPVKITMAGATAQRIGTALSGR
jgi:hypothetical protein